MSAHEDAMREAIALAERAAGLSSPNPPVGAVVVRDGQVVGRGHTQPAGQPHAEVMALRDAGALARGATVVCTLEPCVHTGRTGPCAQALIDAGVAEVAYAVADPTEQASGGHAHLARSGVRVEGGVLAEEAADGALRAWLHSQAHGRPYVIWKVGQSLDGQVAAEDGSSRWITGAESRAMVHRLRQQVDAIIVGAGTVRTDDPRLTARGADDAPADRQPRRVVLSSTGRLPADAHVLDGTAPTVIALGPDTDRRTIEQIAAGGAQAWLSPGRPHEGIDLAGLLHELHRQGALSVLVEGGPTVAGSFAAAGLIDEVQAYIAPKLLVSGMWPAIRGYGVSSIGDAIELKITDVRRIGADVLVTAVRHAEGK